MATATPARKSTPARKPVAAKPVPADLESVADEPDEIAVATPSEMVDEKLDQEALFDELLSDMPELTPAHRLRARQRAGFDRLKMHATVGGVFSGSGVLSFDLDDPADVIRYDAFLDFVTEIDEWAESIAVSPSAYAKWSAGKTGETHMAIFMQYQGALGESRGSEN